MSINSFYADQLRTMRLAEEHFYDFPKNSVFRKRFYQLLMGRIGAREYDLLRKRLYRRTDRNRDGGQDRLQDSIYLISIMEQE